MNALTTPSSSSSPLMGPSTAQSQAISSGYWKVKSSLSINFSWMSWSAHTGTNRSHNLWCICLWPFASLRIYSVDISRLDAMQPVQFSPNVAIAMASKSLFVRCDASGTRSPLFAALWCLPASISLSIQRRKCVCRSSVSLSRSRQSEGGTGAFPLIIFVTYCRLRPICRASVEAGLAGKSISPASSNIVESFNISSRDCRSSIDMATKNKQRQSMQSKVMVLNCDCTAWQCVENIIKALKNLRKAKKCLKIICFHRPAGSGVFEKIQAKIASSKVLKIMDVTCNCLLSSLRKTMVLSLEIMNFGEAAATRYEGLNSKGFSSRRPRFRATATVEAAV